MALATKCPHCGALFRVVADQLKLRGGLVRCGQCRTVFDAIGSLTYVDDGTMTQTRPMNPPAASGTAPNAVPASPVSANTRPGGRRTRTRSTHTSTGRPLGPATTLRFTPGVAPIASAARHDTRMPAAHARAAPAVNTERDAAETAAGVPTLISPEMLRDLVDVPQPSAADGIEVIELAVPAEAVTAVENAEQGSTEQRAEEPDFIRADKRPSQRGFSIFYGGGSALLALLAATQLAIVFRTEIMTRWPQMRPALVQMCTTVGCSLGWPAQPGQLAVMGSELQAIAGTDVLELTAVVRNRASFTQALPALEVTLTDTRNRAVARKVFTAADYLGAAGEPRARIDDGLASGTDLTIKVYFEARGVQPAGFLVYPFHL